MTRRGLLLSLLLLPLISLLLPAPSAFAQADPDASVLGVGSDPSPGSGDPKWAPVVTLPDDSLVVWCEADSICMVISAVDPDETDSIRMSLVSGPIEYTPYTFGHEFTTTVCFWPEASGVFEFVWQFEDRQAHVVVDTVVYTVELGAPPIIGDQQFFAELCDLREPRSLTPAYTGNGTQLLFELLSGPGVIDPQTGVITYQPDTSGVFVFEVILHSECGSDTAVITDQLVLNLPPRCIGFDTAVYLCDPVEICFEIFATDPEGDPIEISMLEGLGAFTQTSDTSGVTCFVPRDADSARYIFIFRAADSCILALDEEALSEPYCCLDTVKVDVIITRPGELSCPSDTTIELCVPPEGLPTQICLAGFSSTWTTTQISFGALSNDTLCFEADTLGAYALELIGSDTCGHADTCITWVTLEGNSVPYVTMPDDYDIDLCVPEMVCFGATADDLDFDIDAISLNYGTYNQTTGMVCFSADTSGVYEIIMTAVDYCGARDADTTRVTVDLHEPPTIDLGEDRRFDLCLQEEICIDAVVTGERIQFFSTSTGAYYNEATSQVCFTPDTSGTYEVFLQVEDACDFVVADTVLVEITLGSAPSITGFADSTVYLCYPQEICLDLDITDPDGDITEIAVNRGRYVNGQVCFVPYGMGTHELIVTVTDACGYVVKDTAYVHVKTDEEIELVCPGDTTIFLCEPDTLCFPVGGIPEGATVTVTGIATYWDAEAQSICFFSDCCLENELTVSVTTACGTYSCSFNVSVQTNSRPLVLLPKDTTVFLCEPGTICLPVGISDIDGNVESVSVTGGSYDAYDRIVCFEALEEGTHVIQVTATDSCGATGYDEVAVTVDFNEAPWIYSTIEDTVFRQCELAMICIPIEAGDPDGQLVIIGYDVDGALEIDPASGDITGVCFTPESYGDHCISIYATDECGLADTTVVCVTVVQPQPVTISCPDAITHYECGPGQFCLDIPITGDIVEVTTSMGTWADGRWCLDFEQTISGDLTIIAVGECNADTCVVPVLLVPVESPQLTCPASIDTLLCGPDTLVFEVPLLSAAGPNETVVATPPAWVEIDGRTARVYVPVEQPGQQTITLTYSSEPCEPYQCSFTVTASFNSAPSLAIEGAAFDFCALEEICLPFQYGDVDDNIVDIYSSVGAVTWDQGAGEFCFTPTGFGEHLITLTSVDECGAETGLPFTVTVNELPQVAISCPVFPVAPTYCDFEPHCLDLPIIGTPDSVRTNYGTWDGGQLCFDFDAPGVYDLEVIAYGPCNSDTCHIQVVYLAPVSVSCLVPDTSLMLCAEVETTVRVPVEITGDQIAGINVIPDTYQYIDGFVEVTVSSEGTYPVSVVAWNHCSRDSCTFTVNVAVNTPPTVGVGDDLTVSQCEFAAICVPFTVDDPDNDLHEIRSSLGVISDHTVCFTPEMFGEYEIIITAVDTCQAEDADTIVVTVVEGQYVTMICPDPVINIHIDLPDTVRVPVGVEPLDVDVSVSPSGYYDYATGEAVVYIESEGSHPFVVTAAAECNVDSCKFSLVVGEYVPPYVECRGTVDTLLCLSRPREVCLPVSVYGTDVQVEVTAPAVFTGDAVCLDISAPGEYVIDILAYTDRDSATCQTVLTVTGGNPPLLEMPPSLDYTLCNPGEVCFDVVMEDAEFDITNILLNYGSYDINTGQVCFYADTAGTYMIEMTVADSCGNSISGLTEAVIGFNEAPQVSLGDDVDIFGCALGEICVDVTIVTDDEVSVVASLGQYNAQTGQVCFTPQEAGSYELVVEVTDQCGLTASDAVTIHVESNQPPVIAPLRDTTLYLCYPRQICLEVSVSDPDGNLASVTTSRGSFTNGNVCFTPYSQGVYPIIVTATDDCGAVVTDTAIVTVRTDQDIELVCPNDTTIFLCEPDTLCFPVGGIPEGAQVTVKGIAAWWNAQTESICFFSDCCLENELTVSVTTACGTYSCSFTVSVQTNSRPLVLLPRDTSITQCALSSICLPVGISDIDGNLASVNVTGATYDAYAKVVCFTPTAEGVHTITVTATDSCGAVSTDQILVTVAVNQAPVISYVPIDTVYKQCEPEEICVPIGISDVDDNIADITVTGGYYNAATGEICIMPGGLGTFCAEIAVTDECGLTAGQEVCVEVIAGDYVDIACPETPFEPFVLCEPQTVCVALDITGDNYTVSPDFGTWEADQLCFVADTTGYYQITVVAAAQCGADTCVVEIPIEILEPLSVTCPENDTPFLCGPDTLYYDFSYTPSSATVSVTAPAFLSQGQVCVPVLEPGSQTITLTVSNQCGTLDCSFTVTAEINGPPVVSAGDDRSFVECDRHEVCVLISISDPDNNITERTTSLGVLSGDTAVCFTPPSYGTHALIVTAVDACGASDVDTVMVTYSEGKHASIQCPDGPQYASICGPDTVCILAPITDAATITISPNGSYRPVTGEVCIYVTQDGTVPVTIIAAAQCGSDTCEFNLNVDMGIPPTIECPETIDTLLCLVSPDTLRVPVTASGTGLQVNVNPTGYYAAGYVNLPISTPGEHIFQIIAFGSCGADTCGIAVNVAADEPPVLTLPAEMTFERCPDDEDEICLDGIFATDAESDVTITKVCGPGTFLAPAGDSGSVCFLPPSLGLFEFCFEADDGCHVVEGSFFVNVVAKEDCDVCFRISIDGGEPTPVGLRKIAAVKVETNEAMGGFDLLIGFDISALSFQVATTAGGAAETWEYFTWNLDNQSCGTACPSGIVRFVGIADRNNGAAHPPDSAYTPNGTLFFIEFQVANDQNLGDVFVPISFIWFDCADNAVSDTTGTLLYIDSRIYNPEGILVWDEFDDVNYPEAARQDHLGAPDSCIVEGEKSQAVRCVEFHNGGIKIIDPGEIDDRGDINLNKIAYEIADAVVFTNYFIRGLSAFTISIPGQIAATDVNADGLTLTVADLSLLIRIIVGDANPIPKTTPYAEQAEVFTSFDSGRLRIAAETAHGIGAAYFVYDVEPGLSIGEPVTLRATTGFEAMAGVRDGQLHVLLYDIGTARVDAGTYDLIELPVFNESSFTLAHAELVDYQSRPYISLGAANLPGDYELMQNYPNPFNPSTTVRFALPVSADWSLKIFNITGALVWERSGHGGGGLVDVLWDGRNMNGEPVASGVYLYRLDANTYSSTRKMILLK